MRKGEVMPGWLRKKIGEAQRGNKYPGRVLSESHKSNIALARKREWESGMRTTAHFRTPEATEKRRIKAIGRVTPLEVRMRQSEVRKGRFGGERHWNWQGGVYKYNKAERASIEYRLWRETVFRRDKYTCQECKKKGVYLHADHIKPFSLYPRLRFEVNNGRTLCKECHLKTDTWGARVRNYGK